MYEKLELFSLHSFFS